jgi:hypothetical protein
MRDVEPKRRGDLVVAGTAGVDLAAYVAEQPLDRRVHVLVGGVEVFDGDRSEPFLDLGELAGREDAGRCKPVDVDQGPLDVVGEKLVVLRTEELPDLGGEASPNPARPQCQEPSSSGSEGGGGGASRRRRCVSSIRCVSAMSLTCTASWPIRSAAVKAVELRSMLRRSGWYVTASPSVSRIV